MQLAWVNFVMKFSFLIIFYSHKMTFVLILFTFFVMNLRTNVVLILFIWWQYENITGDNTKLSRCSHSMMEKFETVYNLSCTQLAKLTVVNRSGARFRLDNASRTGTVSRLSDTISFLHHTWPHLTTISINHMYK